MSSHHSDSLFFFFQAEDGIRDGHVTGVQTCALPICPPAEGRTPARRAVSGRAYPGGMEEDLFSLGGDAPVPRSEERRVGKEGGRGGWGSRSSGEDRRQGWGTWLWGEGR